MRAGQYEAHWMDHMNDVWCIAVGQWDGSEWDQVDVYQPRGVVWSVDEIPTREEIMEKLNSYLGED